MSSLTDKLLTFWHRYENLNLKIALVLISLQLIHLYWLTTDVVIKRLVHDQSGGLSQTGLFFIFFIAIDYIEIPALVSGLTYYGLSFYRDGKSRRRNALFFSLLAVQVFHIFWITDEVVYETLFGPESGIELPFVAAWVAILVDYLELPVIADLFHRTIGRAKRA